METNPKVVPQSIDTVKYIVQPLFRFYFLWEKKQLLHKFGLVTDIRSQQNTLKHVAVTWQTERNWMGVNTLARPFMPLLLVPTSTTVLTLQISLLIVLRAAHKQPPCILPRTKPPRLCEAASLDKSHDSALWAGATSDHAGFEEK